MILQLHHKASRFVSIVLTDRMKKRVRGKKRWNPCCEFNIWFGFLSLWQKWQKSSFENVALAPAPLFTFHYLFRAHYMQCMANWALVTNSLWYGTMFHHFLKPSLLNTFMERIRLNIAWVRNQIICVNFSLVFLGAHITECGLLLSSSTPLLVIQTCVVWIWCHKS